MKRHLTIRRAFKLFLACAAVGLASCQAVPDARPVALDSPEAACVRAALARWPRPAAGDVLRQPFSATLQVGGARIAASGLLEYHGPRDFRVTASTELGAIVFDARVNWGGVAVLRSMPGLDPGALEVLLSDLVRAFDLPRQLDGLKAGDAKMVLTRRLADAHDYTWIFSRADGRLLETDVDLGLFDMLRVTYDGDSARGWPRELQVIRRARSYDMSFSFIDDVVVQGRDNK